LLLVRVRRHLLDSDSISLSDALSIASNAVATVRPQPPGNHGARLRTYAKHNPKKYLKYVLLS
jgi:hypothetical protein